MAGTRSKCCGARVKLVGEERPHYECNKCKQYCEIMVKERHTWEINPVTRVKPNKNAHPRRLTPQEQRELIDEEERPEIHGDSYGDR